MTRRERQYSRCSPTQAGWWGRLLVAGFVAFYLSYVPYHVATATHLNDLLASSGGSVVDHDDQSGGDHGHDADHHVPHPASDHTLNLHVWSSSPLVLSAVFCVLADFSIPAGETDQCVLVIPFLEHVWRPGESPPEPSQPRAPPSA